MSVFETINLFPSFPNYLIVQWEIKFRCILERVSFNIFCSTNPEKDFVKINVVPLVDTYIFFFPFPLLFKQEYLFVRIEAVIDGKSYVSDPQGLFHNLPKDQFLIVKEMMFSKNLVREKIYGIPVLVFKRKNFGVQCRDCIDSASELKINSRCETCLGTRYEGGFFAPIRSKIEVDEQSTRTIDPTEIGNIDNVTARLKLTYPLVQKGDMVVEEQRNVRWHINQVARELYMTFPFDQVAEGRRISPKDIGYQVKLDIEKEQHITYGHAVETEDC